MTARIALLAFVSLSLTACDGALTIGAPDEGPLVIDTTAPAASQTEEGEIGEAESTDTLWDGSYEVLRSPWSSCKEKGRWATLCVDGDGCCPSYCSADNDSDCAPLVPEPTPDPDPSTDPPPPAPEPACGDGTVDDGEVCDGDCPTSCDSGDACTVGTLMGSADTCDAVCSYDAVTACTNGDGCCPTGCTTANDDDCAAVCGNDLVEANELCDGNCPSSCDDGDACTTDRLDGSANTCDAMCGHTVVTACDSGDGCCPTGCTYDLDQDCPMPPPPTDPPAIDCTDPATWPQQWKDYEDQVITLVNQRRAAGASCGSRGSFAPAGPVSMNPQMRQASRCHSWDMDTNMYFSHTSQDGRSFVTRLQEAGYTGSPRGENIAAGYSTPESVVNGWMNSDGHCANIMNAGIDRMGIGVTNENRYTWTMTTGVGD